MCGCHQCFTSWENARHPRGGLHHRCSTFPWLGPSCLWGDERCRNIQCPSYNNGTTQPDVTRNVGSQPLGRYNSWVVDDLENCEPYWPTQPISKYADFIDFNGCGFADFIDFNGYGFSFSPNFLIKFEVSNPRANASECLIIH